MNSPPLPVLLLATGNRHKVREIEAILRALLPSLDFETQCAADFADVEEPEETGSTFEENAALKARYYANATGLLALADDSGLVVDALDGRPGIHSARYAETSTLRNERVLAEVEAIPTADRSARFVCVAALADSSGNCTTRRGTIEGRITENPCGAGGFGYDPIFEPVENGVSVERTLAEYSESDKNAISHRGRAINALAEVLGRSIPEGRVREAD